MGSNIFANKDYRITPEKIKEMKEFLKKRPPDPAWDWTEDVWDVDMPADEFRARCYRGILQDLGELDKD